MKPISYLSALFAAALVLHGCSSTTENESGNGNNGNSGGSNTSVVLPANVTDAINAPKSVLSQEVKDALAYMYSEEGLAHDLYLNIYTYQPARQLQNIATRSEVKHIEAVNQLAIKYDLNMTQYPDTDIPYDISGIGNGNYPVDTVQYLYNLLYDKGIRSQQDALEVGCMVEVVDIDDLNGYIAAASASGASDVVTVLDFLRSGSYNHYWAFDAGLKNMGIADGCCSVPDALGHTYCHPEYPQN